MSTFAKIAYLTALIAASAERVTRYQRNLEAAVEAHDQAAAQARLTGEEYHQQELTGERARLQA